MSIMKHSLSDSDITTELSSRRKFLRGLALVSTTAGLVALGITGASAEGDMKDCGNEKDRNTGACVIQE